MLTAVIVGTDKDAIETLRATMQQTGLIHSVRDWEPVAERYPPAGEPVPDVVLLDLSSAPRHYFEFAAHLHRIRPGVGIIACSSTSPEQNLLLQAMRSGVQEFLTKPVSPETLRGVISRFGEERAPTGGPVAGKLIVVAGSKGGVGTSTVAVNLGVQVAQLTKMRVALFDFARPLGHLSLLLDLQPRFNIRDALENIDRLDGHFLGGLITRHKTGLEVLAGASNSEDWQGVSIPTISRIVSVGQSVFDFLLVDAGVVDVSEWAPALRMAHAVLLVAEPSLLALWTLERHLTAASSAGFDRSRIHIVINRWRRVDDDAIANVEKNLKQPVHTRLPNDYRQVSEAVTLGMPLTGNASNPLVARFRDLAASLTGVTPTDGERRGALSSLFSTRK